MQGNPYGQAYPYDVALYAAVQELHHELMRDDTVKRESVPQSNGAVTLIAGAVQTLRQRFVGMRGEVHS